MLLAIRSLTVMVVLLLIAPAAGFAEETAGKWRIPVAGNAFRTTPSPGENDFRRNEVLAWSETGRVFSIYFRIDRQAELQLSLNARVPRGRSTIAIMVGERKFTIELEGDEFFVHQIGRVEIPSEGYVRVDLQGGERTGRIFAEVHDLVVSSSTKDLKVDYVKTNQGNMFYWGRRGPSVHLRYQVPVNTELQYAYTEISVPEGQDTIGSFFMANGFGEGYFGMQVNSAKERRVLFSVWSPFRTDHPDEIPEDQRVISLGSGPDVCVGQFGNEGSGGQSVLIDPWKAGVTYRFLTEVKPDGPSDTVYTAWFGEKTEGAWRLIASFRRPKTSTHLRGFHSFLESFDPDYGHIERSAHYGNVWVCDTAGQWHECTKASFSVDATGGGRHRLDFTGGAEGEQFFLRNCGFFDETGTPGDTFTRRSIADGRPKVDFDVLPRP